MKNNYLKEFCVVISSYFLVACSGPGILDEGSYRAAKPEQIDHSQLASGAIYASNRSVGLFEDFRARQVGDTLTVLLIEATQAVKSADTAIAKSNSTAVDNPVLAGRTRTIGSDGDTLEFEMSSGHEFNGEAESNQSNSLQGEVTVTVAEVYPNGNLYIQGEKWIKINQGNEYIRLRGIVRPADIGPDNTVVSSRVADAWISYGSRGALAEANNKPWLSRFFSSGVFPF